MPSPSDSGCIFCRIVAGQAPASMVYADDRAVAFMDIRPAVPGHVLVIPRAHVADLAGLDPDDAAHLMRVAQRVTAAVRGSGIRCEGVNLFLADGEAAGQEVSHVHLHLIPRYLGDGMRIGAAFGHPGRDELDAQAALIRAALQISPGP